MAYLHCHNCRWGQDDFWHEGYNPGKSATDYYNRYIKEPDKKYYMDIKWIQNAKVKWGRDAKGYYVTAKDMYVWEMERLARSIASMDVPTMKRWAEVKDKWRCPDCGKQTWDID